MAIYKENEADIDCSVIIPSYNSARSIKFCLDSVLGQKTALNYEVIVADSSNDETPEIIRNHYPTVSLIHFAHKTDPGTARNAAIKKARGEIILCTDSDCTPAPDWLEQMVQTHRRKSGCRIVGGSVINANPESIASIAGYLNEFSEYLPTADARMVNSLPTCNISYRRDIFEEYGGYNRKYYPQEDYYFHWRVNKGGDKIYFCPWIQVRHFHRSRLSSFLLHNYRFGIVTVTVLKVTDLPGSNIFKNRWLAPFFLPFLPFIKFTNTCLRVAHFAPEEFRKPLVFPLMFIGLFAWGIGFITGTYNKS